MPANPLLLPEILIRLAHLVPCWGTRSITELQNMNARPDDKYWFLPKELLACSSVCRLWYSIFYRQLWIVYDGEIMSPLSFSVGRQVRPFTYSIPEEILIAQSPNFRILSRFNGRLPWSNNASLQCRHLIDLTLYQNCPRSCHLVQTNGATLRRLSWHGNVPYSGMLSDLEGYSMSTLKNLECLVLAQWDVSENRLIPVLEQNQRTLQEMDLKFLQGLDSLPEGLKMERMRALTLDGEWDENEAVIDLIQACPKLEKLTLEWSLAEGGGAELDQLRAHLLDRQLPLKEEERTGGGSIVFAL